MDASKLQSSRNSVKLAIEIAVNLGLIIFILIWALMILKPFLALVIWGAIIAVASYTPFLKLQSIFKGSKKLAVIAFTVIGLSIVIIPTSMFSESLIKSSINLAHHIAEGTVDIPPPSENVKEWPVIGKRVHTAWSKAANNFTLFVNDNAHQVKEISAIFLTKAAGVGLGILSLVFAILIAAAFLSNAEVAAMSMQRLFRRLAGEQGDKLLDLSAATIRSVATGVLGIAFIQAMLGGLGMVVVGVPGAGLWALFVLIVAIAQLPPWLILGPVIVYVFSVESSMVATMFMVWSLVVSFLDMALKPVMLGRGVEAPMLVILLGAIGGMVMSGIIGLFIGAVILAMAYKLFQAWLEMGEVDIGASTADDVVDPGQENSPTL